jgi:hypothetical protein
MADLQKAIQQRPPNSKINGMDFTEEPIHNLETWKKLGLLSEEIYLQLTVPQKENNSNLLNGFAVAVDKLGDYIIAGLNTTGDCIILFGETLQKNANSLLKSKITVKKPSK